MLFEDCCGCHSGQIGCWGQECKQSDQLEGHVGAQARCDDVLIRTGATQKEGNGPGSGCILEVVPARVDDCVGRNKGRSRR